LNTILLMAGSFEESLPLDDQLYHLLVNARIASAIVSHWIQKNEDSLIPAGRIFRMGQYMGVFEKSLLNLEHLSLQANKYGKINVYEDKNAPQDVKDSLRRWKREVSINSGYVRDAMSRGGQFFKEYIVPFYDNDEKNYNDLLTHLRSLHENPRKINIFWTFEDVEKKAKNLGYYTSPSGMEIGKNVSSGRSPDDVWAEPTSCKVCNKIAVYVDTKNNKFCSDKCQGIFY
jgi:hypothetical protein